MYIFDSSKTADFEEKMLSDSNCSGRGELLSNLRHLYDNTRILLGSEPINVMLRPLNGECR